MRILLSAQWKEAESFALGRGNPDSTSLLVLGDLTPAFPPEHTTEASRAMSLLLEVGKTVP